MQKLKVLCQFWLYASIKKICIKLLRKPCKPIFFRCSRGDNSIVSDRILPMFKLIHAFMYVTNKNEEAQTKIEGA